MRLSPFSSLRSRTSSSNPSGRPNPIGWKWCWVEVAFIDLTCSSEDVDFYIKLLRCGTSSYHFIASSAQSQNDDFLVYLVRWRLRVLRWLFFGSFKCSIRLWRRWKRLSKGFKKRLKLWKSPWCWWKAELGHKGSAYTKWMMIWRNKSDAWNATSSIWRHD